MGRRADGASRRSRRRLRIESDGQSTRKDVTVRQTGSPIRRKADQRATLIGLGLNRIGRTSTLQDNASIRGMIAKVAHMVAVVE